ncbi:MAG: hypothetical protein ACI3YH_08850 [Eubacteriales bacterium]
MKARQILAVPTQIAALRSALPFPAAILPTTEGGFAILHQTHGGAGTNSRVPA